MSDASIRNLERAVERGEAGAVEALKRAKARTQAEDVRGMDVKTRAKRIRAALKRDYGWTNKHVSVRISRYSMGQSITCTIKAPEIPQEAVEEVARSFQSVRYCDYSGEILSGGNTFVSVSYDDAIARDLAEMLGESVGHGFKFGPYRVHCPDGGWGHVFKDTADGGIVGRVFNDSSARETLAYLIVNDGALWGRDGAA